MARGRYEALFVGAAPFLGGWMIRLVQLAAFNRLPASLLGLGCNVALMAVLGVVLGLVISAGYSAGFDRRLAPNESGRWIFALGSALTNKVYGLGGYVSVQPVEAALQAGGLATDPDQFLPDNFYDNILINNAIKQASNLSIQIPRPELQYEAHNVRASPGDDLGLVDFVLLSFSLFSPSVEAFYPTFLIIFCGSVFLYWCAFRGKPVYLAILLLQCIVFYVLFVSPLFHGIPAMSHAWTTPATPHFLSTLAVVPLLHVLATISRRQQASLMQVGCLIGQALILYFVIRIRLSAAWAVGPLLVGAMLAVLRPRKGIRNSERQTHAGHKPGLADAAARTPVTFFSSLHACWPVLLVLVVLVGTHLKFETYLHPLYSGEQRLRHHSIWHEIYYGLQQHPQWTAKYGNAHQINGKIATGDEQPIAAIYRILDAHPEIDRSEILDTAGSMYWGAIEKYSRRALIEFVREDPWFFVENLAHKLIALLRTLKWILLLIISSLSLSGVALVVMAIVGAALATASLSDYETRSYWRFLALLCICVPFSWLPNLCAIVGWELMADAIVLLLLVAFILSSWIIAWAAGLVISQGMRWRNTQSRLDAENRRFAALSAKGDPLRADTPSLDS